MIETVCKHILDAGGAAYEESSDLPKLYALTARQLNLSPSQHTEQLFKHRSPFPTKEYLMSNPFNVAWLCQPQCPVQNPPKLVSVTSAEVKTK